MRRVVSILCFVLCLTAGARLEASFVPTLQEQSIVEFQLDRRPSDSAELTLFPAAMSESIQGDWPNAGWTLSDSSSTPTPTPTPSRTPTPSWTPTISASPTPSPTGWSGSISANTTWTQANSPYIVSGQLTVGSGVTLTIEAGGVVKFRPGGSLTGGSLRGPGVLSVQGTAAHPVVFTSYRDDAYGGDTNGDGAATLPAAGDWQDICIYNSGTALQYAIIRYGRGMGGPGMLSIYGTATPIVRHVTFEHAYQGYNLWQHIAAIPTYEGLAFTDGYRAICVGGQSGGGGGPATSLWKNVGWPYLVTENAAAEQGASLTIEAGVVVKLRPNRNMGGYGVLWLLGTADSPVVFTSYRDDSYGGDTDGDGGVNAPAPGDWDYIHVSNSATDFHHAVVRYGKGGRCGPGMLCVRDASPIVRDSTFSNALGPGISVYNASPAITANSITRNYRGIYVLGASPVIHHNDIFSNTDHGLYYASPSPMLNAENNWWGAASGPTHPGNPSGTGDRVYGNVDYTPWVTGPNKLTFSISGRVTDGAGGPLSGVTITLSSGVRASTDVSGYYTVTGLVTGTYVLTPTLGGHAFSPPTREVSVPPHQSGIDYTGSTKVPPRILSSGVSPNPANPSGCEQATPLTFWAQVTDDVAVSSVILRYQLPDESSDEYVWWREKMMATAGNGIYSATLGPLDRSGAYSYYVRADDDDNNLAASNTELLWINDCSAPLQILQIEVNQALGQQKSQPQFVAGKHAAIRVFLTMPVTWNGAEQHVVVWRNGSRVTTLIASRFYGASTVLEFVCPSATQCGCWQQGNYAFDVAVNGALARAWAVFHERQRLRILAVPVRVNSQSPDDQWKGAGSFLLHTYPIASDGLEWIWYPQELVLSNIDLTTWPDREKLWRALDNLNPPRWLGLFKPEYDAVVGFIPPMYIPSGGGNGERDGWTLEGTTTIVVKANGIFTTEQDVNLVDWMQAVVAHEVGHVYDLGDEYAGGGSLACCINPPPASYSGSGTVKACPHPTPPIQCSDPSAADWHKTWRAQGNNSSGSVVRADRDRPYEVGVLAQEMRARGALGDKLSFMGSGETQANYWITPDIYKHLFDKFTPSILGTVSPMVDADVILVSGWLGRDGSVSLDPWYRLSGPAPALISGTYSIEAVDVLSHTLATQGFEVSFVALTDPPTDIDPAPFGAVVPSPLGTQAFRIKKGERVLRAVPVSPHAPSVSITAPAVVESISGTYTITWQCEDLDDDVLYHTVEYSHDGQDWFVLAAQITHTLFTTDFDALPGGEQARLRVVTTDGINTAEATSAPFKVATKPPEVFIESPAPGAHSAWGLNVTLYGSAYDPQEGWLRSAGALVWTSDRDGLLGRGDMLNLQSLSLGQHTITLSATNSLSVTTSASVAIAIDLVFAESQLSLLSGWNLVSLPLAPADPVITQALSSIAGQYDLVYAYDAFAATPWKKYNTSAPPFLNTLSTINETQGLWIRVSDPVSLTITGSVPMNPVISLRQGWNLVGYPSQATQPITEALASIADKYDLVYAYDPANEASPWKKYNVSAPPFLNTLKEMGPGWGYWIRAKEDCLWQVP